MNRLGVRADAESIAASVDSFRMPSNTSPSRSGRSSSRTRPRSSRTARGPASINSRRPNLSPIVWRSGPTFGPAPSTGVALAQASLVGSAKGRSTAPDHRRGSWRRIAYWSLDFGFVAGRVGGADNALDAYETRDNRQLQARMIHALLGPGALAAQPRRAPLQRAGFFACE